MRLRAFAVVPLLLAGATVAAPVATAAAGPVVGPVTVAGRGPGDLVRATGTGFDAGAGVAVTFVGAAGSVPLVDAVAGGDGTVTLPVGTRTPLSAAPGIYHLTFTPEGSDAVTSSPFALSPPAATVPATVQPGHPAFMLDRQFVIGLVGLANTPDVVRTVSLDGVAATATKWYADENAFADSGIAFTAPSDLTVGPHSLTFTQTGPTPYSVTQTVAVPAPTMTTGTNVAPTANLALSIRPTGWTDDFDVTVVGASGDRHPGQRFTVTHTGAWTTTTSQIEIDHVSPGTATVTAVSRLNGATAGATFVVDAPSVTSPGGLAPGQAIATADGARQFLLQQDGNLLYGVPGFSWWTTNTAGHPGARLTVQPDGNVVLRAPDGKALWNTGTAGIGAGARLGFDASGDLAVFAASGREAWARFSLGPQLLPSLTANHYLFKEQMLSHNILPGRGGSVNMKVQADGNVVLSWSAYGVRWATGTSGHPNAYLLLQNDGNLVVRAPNGSVLWSNGVHALGARIVAQSDGNVVEYAPNGKALWSTRTVVR